MGLFNWAFGWMSRRVFHQVDYNKNGVIEAIEVEVAILKLYNLINKRLPGWQDPPKRAEIMNALRAYDEDGNGTLDEKEFELFARSLMKTGPDAFFARVGKSAVVQTAFLPAAAAAVQKLTPNSPVGNTPLHFLAPIIGTVMGAVRGLVPF